MSLFIIIATATPIITSLTAYTAFIQGPPLAPLAFKQLLILLPPPPTAPADTTIDSTTLELTRQFTRQLTLKLTLKFTLKLELIVKRVFIINSF